MNDFVRNNTADQDKQIAAEKRGDLYLYHVLSESKGQSVRMDQADTSTLYIGKAAPGSAASAAVWQIQRLVEATPLTNVDFADGTAAFDKVWDNRASYTY